MGARIVTGEGKIKKNQQNKTNKLNLLSSDQRKITRYQELSTKSGVPLIVGVSKKFLLYTDSRSSHPHVKRQRYHGRHNCFTHHTSSDRSIFHMQVQSSDEVSGEAFLQNVPHTSNVYSRQVSKPFLK